MFHKHACKIFLFSNWYTCKLLCAFIYLFFICSVVEKKKTVHNSTEKKRKEQIRHWIQQIGEQLPPLVTQKTEKERHGRVKIDWLNSYCFMSLVAHFHYMVTPVCHYIAAKCKFYICFTPLIRKRSFICHICLKLGLLILWKMNMNEWCPITKQ